MQWRGNKVSVLINLRLTWNSGQVTRVWNSKDHASDEYDHIVLLYFPCQFYFTGPRNISRKFSKQIIFFLTYVILESFCKQVSIEKGIIGMTPIVLYDSVDHIKVESGTILEFTNNGNIRL